VAIDRRLLAISLAAAVAVSIGGGYLVSRAGNDGQPADDDITLDTPGEAQIPSIGTNAVVTGTPLPDATLVDSDGNEVSSADLIGHPLVINVWNSTCAPCKRELPAFAAVQRDLGDSIRFVGVNNLDPADVNESFARDRGVEYELFRDTQDSFGSALGIATLPVTLFVRADGTILRQTGVLDEQDLRDYAAELLAA
jgi:thiol-disulfide isomerase/thioredoxin